MEASSNAYAETSLYKRTTAIIDHADGRNYVVDFFRVAGGDIQDYVFHTDDADHELMGISLQSDSHGRLYDFKNIKSQNNSEVWNVKWTAAGNMKCVAWAVPQEEERTFMGDGWGQRDWKNSDIGRTIPYVVRRCRGTGIKTFVSLFEGYQSADAFVKKAAFKNGALVVDTSIGRDYIMSDLDTGLLKVPMGSAVHQVSGRFVCVSVRNGRIDWEEHFDGES